MTSKRQKTTTIPMNLIAPCGMNCRLCLGYIREKNTCPGCRMIDKQDNKKSEYRNRCRIRNCELIANGKVKYCSDNCARFPCARLKELDKRYRTKYGMSMMDNLKMINGLGIRHFIQNEKEKWLCPECGEMICVHRPVCLSCGYKWHRGKIAQPFTGADPANKRPGCTVQPSCGRVLLMLEDKMFEKLKNPSAAIKKRLAKIGVYRVDNDKIENAITKIPIIKHCFRKIERATIDNALFHGFDSIESYIKILSEYGFDKNEEHLSECIRILVETSIDHPFYERGISKIGRILEDEGFSGSKTIRDSLLASLGFKDHGKLKETIDHSLACFIAVTKYEDIHDFSYSQNGKWVFKENCLFPDYYNLRMLAFSKIWKSEKNVKLVNQAINQLKRLQPLPPIYVKERGRLIAPGSYLMHEFDVDYFRCNDDKKAEWLLRNEYFARMGVLSSLKIVIMNLSDDDKMIEESRKIKKSYSFMNWGAYSGLSLEENWRKLDRKLNDIIFRLGLIKYYYNMNCIA